MALRFKQPPQIYSIGCDISNRFVSGLGYDDLAWVGGWKQIAGEDDEIYTQ